jgi:DNA repair protein RecO (recombination protein O)
MRNCYDFARFAGQSMQQVDEAFVLRTQPLGDADLIVSLLARTHGHVRGVARSARRSRKRFGGLLEPMTHVEATWTTRAGVDLHRIESLDSRHSYAAMQADPVHQSVCAVMSEIAGAFGTEGQGDDREFRLLRAVLDALEDGGDPLLLLRYFEFWTLRLHGLLGDPGECAACGLALARGRAQFLADDGGFLCPGCRDGAPGQTTLNADEAAWVDHLLRLEPKTLPASGSVAKPGRRLGRLFQKLLESFAERRFRSYRHVRALGAWTGDNA